MARLSWRATCANRFTRVRWAKTRRKATLMLQVPLTEQGRFAGTVMGEYSVDGLMRFGMPPEIMARYAVALIDDRERVLAGSLQSPKRRAAHCCPGRPSRWSTRCRSRRWATD